MGNDDDDDDDDDRVRRRKKQKKKDRIIARYDAFASSVMNLGLVPWAWSHRPLLDGEFIRRPDVLPNLPKSPVFREVMDEQKRWMVLYPDGTRRDLVRHLRDRYP